MLDTLRLIGALLLIFFIPGIMLIQALFPRKGELDNELEWLYRLALGIGLSIVITILVNFGLNSLGVNPDTGMGYVTAGPITLCLILLSLLFFIIAWVRGGMLFMGRLHPSFIRFPAADMRDDDIPHVADKKQRFKHQELMKEKYQLIHKISKCEKLIDAHSGEQKKYYEESREKLLSTLTELENMIASIEKGLPTLPSDTNNIDEKLIDDEEEVEEVE